MLIEPIHLQKLRQQCFLCRCDPNSFIRKTWPSSCSGKSFQENQVGINRLWEVLIIQVFFSSGGQLSVGKGCVDRWRRNRLSELWGVGGGKYSNRSWDDFMYFWILRRDRNVSPSCSLGWVSAWTRQIYCQVSLNQQVGFPTWSIDRLNILRLHSNSPPGCGRSSTTPPAKTRVRSSSPSPSSSALLSTAPKSLLRMSTWVRWPKFCL